MALVVDARARPRQVDRSLQREQLALAGGLVLRLAAHRDVVPVQRGALVSDRSVVKAERPGGQREIVAVDRQRPPGDADVSPEDEIAVAVVVPGVLDSGRSKIASALPATRRPSPFTSNDSVSPSIVMKDPVAESVND